MRSFSGFSRFVIAFVAAAFFANSVSAQSDVATDAPWQGVISHQIQAFRDGDAPEAFVDAGRMFHAAFPDAFAFFGAIVTSGYSPIMESTSHSFGEFKITEDGVVQMVTFVGKSQELYDAVYQLMEEDGVWRVQGVLLQKSAAIGV